MALSLDASTPAVATANAQTVTTASFTPPAGAVLYAMALHGANTQNVDRTSTISDSTGLTWTSQVSTPLGPSPAPNGSLARLWTATVVTSTAMTVTSTITSNGFNGSTLRVLVYTGADSANPVDGSAFAGSQNAVISQTITTTYPGTVPWIANTDWTPGSAPTAASGTTTDTNSHPNAGGDQHWIGTKAASATPGSVTLASSAPTSGNLNSWIMFGVRPKYQTLFTTQTPANTNNSDGTPGITPATSMRFSVAGVLAAIRFYCTINTNGTWIGEVWEITALDSAPGTGTLLATKTLASTPVSGGWSVIPLDNLGALDAPVTIATNKIYRIGVYSGDGRYVNSPSTGPDSFSSGLTNGNIIADADNTSNPGGLLTGTLYQGTFVINGTAGTYPNGHFNSNNYFVDVLFDASSTPATSAPAEQAAVAAVANNATVSTSSAVNAAAGQSAVAADAQTAQVANGNVTEQAAVTAAAQVASVANGNVTEQAAVTAGALDASAANGNVTQDTAVGAAAYDATVSTSSSVNAAAEQTAVGVVAYDATVTVSGSTNAQADYAPVTTSALSPYVDATTLSALATAAADAYLATAANGNVTEAALVGAAAFDATTVLAAGPPADFAAVTASALDATTSTATATNASAAPAAVTAAAFDAGVALGVPAGVALVDVVALQPPPPGVTSSPSRVLVTSSRQNAITTITTERLIITQ